MYVCMYVYIYIIAQKCNTISHLLGFKMLRLKLCRESLMLKLHQNQVQHHLSISRSYGGFITENHGKIAVTDY